MRTTPVSMPMPMPMPSGQGHGGQVDLDTSKATLCKPPFVRIESIAGGLGKGKALLLPSINNDSKNIFSEKSCISAKARFSW